MSCRRSSRRIVSLEIAPSRHCWIAKHILLRGSAINPHLPVPRRVRLTPRRRLTGNNLLIEWDDARHRAIEAKGVRLLRLSPACINASIWKSDEAGSMQKKKYVSFYGWHVFGLNCNIVQIGTTLLAIKGSSINIPLRGEQRNPDILECRFKHNVVVVEFCITTAGKRPHQRPHSLTQLELLLLSTATSNSQ